MRKSMKILAIETSCDETSCAVVEDGRTVLSNVTATQIEEHKLYGGVVPEIASRRHCESIVGVCESALEQAEVTLTDIDAVAVTCAPGLIGALLVGVNFAKGIALAHGKPLIPVHHIRAHIASNYLCHPDLAPPYLALVVSGGHTSLIHVKDYTEYEVIGQTLDDAAGEAFDKAARAMGFPYPGGICIDRESKLGDPSAFKLPKPKTENPLDFSFSGLKTSVINLVHGAKQSGTKLNFSDLAASFQYTVCEILSGKALRAANELGVNKIAVSGGVAANSGLRAALPDAICPALEYCGDNAAMVGCQAYYEFLAGNIADASLNACATLRIADA
jgi:N6-L-threonylcarbamoyladenine synthase